MATAPVEVPLPTFARARPRVAAAATWSGVLHAGQERESDRAPFVLHPLEVAAALDAAGATDDVLVAAVLHDTLEDTGASLAELEERFGGRVARIVGALTDDPSITEWRARKAALRERLAHADDDVLLVFTADKLCKVRELRLGRAVRPEKLEHYRLSLDLAAARLRDHPLVRLLRFELEALDQLPPR